MKRTHCHPGGWCYNRAVIRIDLFTLFPEICWPYLSASILKRAQDMLAFAPHVHDIRAYTADRHHITDDTPYGGGGGMVLKPEPIFAAVEANLPTDGSVPIILTSPQGRPFTQAVARALAELPRFAIIAGRYEGVDERVRQHLVTHEYSLGDFVLTGGELPALAMIDAVVRLLPGVLGDPTATRDDSFSQDTGLLEYPHYTRPPVFRGWAVPDVLQHGHLGEIGLWRRREALRRTFERRPELLQKAALSDDDWAYIHTLAAMRDQARHTDDE